MTHFDELITMRDKQREARAAEPVVISGAEIAWEESSLGHIKWYLHPSAEAPRAFVTYVQHVPGRQKTGRLLTQGGTLFYLLQGNLVSTVNDETYYWRAGDLLTLPILRDGVTYQHFNLQGNEDAQFLAVEANTTTSLGIDKGCGFELVEPAGTIGGGGTVPQEGGPSAVRNDGRLLTEAPVIDPIIDIQYHRDIERWKWIRERNDRGRLLNRGDDLSWEQNRQGRVKYYLNPEFSRNAVRDWTFFLHDIQTHTGKHRHQGGILIFVVEGEGYTIVDGTRHDWSSGDLIMLPLKPGGVEHEHHNRRPGETCHWVASFYWPWWELVASEFTQLKEHPDYVPIIGVGASRRGEP